MIISPFTRNVLKNVARNLRYEDNPIYFIEPRPHKSLKIIQRDIPDTMLTRDVYVIPHIKSGIIAI